jgi:two-component system response regulator YesN
MLHQHLDSTWLQTYRQARQDYRNSLETLAPQGIEAATHTIRSLFAATGTDIRLTLLVKINQDLQGIIDETLAGASTDIASSEAFSPGEISFAIGGNTTIEHLMAHHQAIAAQFIDARVQENQRKQRLDIGAVKAYIDTHYTQRISLEALAESFHASKEYLSTLFRKETGETFTDYITRLRMEQARQLITNLHIPLKRVPELVGYIDIPHFHRTFKRYFGTTPGSMRPRSVDDHRNPEGPHTPGMPSDPTDEHTH